jgi:hypothetical protein
MLPIDLPTSFSFFSVTLCLSGEESFSGSQAGA